MHCKVRKYIIGVNDFQVMKKRRSKCPIWFQAGWEKGGDNSVFRDICVDAVDVADFY